MFRTRSPMIKKSDNITSFIIVLWRYVIYSGVFWAIFSLFCLIILYDPTYGEKSSIHFFESWHLSILFISAIFAFILLSFIIGSTISIPSIILKILIKIRIEKKLSKGEKSIFLNYISKYFPIITCIFSHLIILLISTSTAPQQMRNWFNHSSKIYILQKKIYQEIFEPDLPEIFENWKSVSLKFNKDSKFIFLLPENLLLNKNLFNNTKNYLNYESNWLLYSLTKEATTASILDEVNFTDERLFSPAPLQSYYSKSNELYSKKNIKTNNYIGINGKNLINFSYLFQKDSLNKNFNNTWFTIFLNRIIVSQPQLFFIYKINLMSHILPYFNWENLTNNNSDLLLNYSKQLKNIEIRKNVFVFFLSELEHSSYNSLLQAIEFPKNITKNEFEECVKNTDSFLSQAIRGLKASGHKNIMVVPYSQNDKKLNYGYGFSNIDFKDKIFNTKLLNYKLTNNENINNCNQFVTNYDYKNSQNNKLNYTLLDTITQKVDNFPYIKKDLFLTIKNEIKYGIICQITKKTSYIIFKKDIYVNNKINIYNNLRYLLFSDYNNMAVQKNIANDYSNNKNNLNYNIFSFFKQFEILKINLHSNELLNITDSEQDQFIKTYGNDVKNKFYSFINLSIQ